MSRVRGVGAANPNNNWFIAQLVERISVQDDSRSVVHVNYVLVSAKNAQAALRKSRLIGRASEISYQNSDGKKVDILFVGLRDLSRVYDDLADGAELIFTESVGLSADDIKMLVRTQRQLSAFRKPVEPHGRPNYAAADVLREATKISKNKKYR